ncbi:hypothetical protein [Actinoallomurus sp. CA-142502]|uniref:hypothetical protein n=1 Tax=Actinoallomurus sp. CA-142502 TaxID=3239885 RepID=UPI003D94B228
MATTQTADKPEFRCDPSALLDCAERLRPDINRRDLEGALINARDTGCPWPWTFVITAQILASGETAYDLHNAVRNWRLTHTGRPS